MIGGVVVGLEGVVFGVYEVFSDVVKILVIFFNCVNCCIKFGCVVIKFGLGNVGDVI